MEVTSFKMSQEHTSLTCNPLSPPRKKQKSEINSNANVLNIVPILEDLWSTSEVSLGEIFSGELKSKKDASKLLSILDPIPHEFEHLKRIRNREGILEIIIGDAAISYDHPAYELLSCVRKILVPSLRPLSTLQFKKSNEFWPCNFHPDKEIEKLFTVNCGFKESEVDTISKNIKMVMRRFHVTGLQSCLVYDPRDADLVCIANSSLKILGHSVMNCLNILSSLQKCSKKEDVSTEQDYGEVLCTRVVRNKHSDYLCTDLDIFMSHEPCIMCAMALLHSRAKRLFYVNDSHLNGGLRSVVKLHCLDGINHRFQVFKIQ